jgi:hypothetical protein
MILKLAARYSAYLRSIIGSPLPRRMPTTKAGGLLKWLAYLIDEDVDLLCLTCLNAVASGNRLILYKR